jgi:DNA polymerase-3 subunit beta
MKISVLQENLNTALNNVSRFISNKNQLPILNNLLLSTDNGRLKLSATNLELSINYWIGAKIDQEGSITLPPKEITEFISYLSSGKIDLSLEGDNLLSISSSKINSTFTTIPALDYPEFSKIDSKTSFDLDLNNFLNSISQIIFSAATDDMRPVLTAVLCQFTKQNLTLVATDGFRLSIKEIKFSQPLDFTDDQQITFLIPAKSLLEIVKLAKNNQKIKLGLSTDEHQIIFVLDDIEIISRLVDGDYPDYQKIVPQN